MRWTKCIMGGTGSEQLAIRRDQELIPPVMKTLSHYDRAFIRNAMNM